MRRLIDWIYLTFFGLRLRTLDQFIDEQKKLIDDMAAQRKEIDEQMDQAFTRLINAVEIRDTLIARHAAAIERNASLDRLANSVPRSY